MKQWMVAMVGAGLSLMVLTGCNRGGCGRKPPVEAIETSALDQLRIEVTDLKVEVGREAAIARRKYSRAAVAS